MKAIREQQVNKYLQARKLKNNKMTYKNKVVWITGASSGIGEALVYAFDKREAKIIISARRENELERVKNNCKNKENIKIIQLDLEIHDQMQEKANKVYEEFNNIDYLFNNGGLSQRSLAKDTPLAIDKRLMDINFFGTIALTKAVLPKMIKQKQGHIIVTSSVTGKIGTSMRSAYAASKHALHGFFDSLRAEVAQDNIFITLLCPGYVTTNISVNAVTANGTAQNTMDKNTAKGLKPKVLAEKIIKAVSKKREEIYPGGFEMFGIFLKKFFPKILSKILKNRKSV